MKIRPLTNYAEPNYPTSDYLVLHPELLQALPSRWRCHPAVVTALATVCALLVQRDCLAQAQPSATNRQSTVPPQKAEKVTPAAAVKTAPIFEHGKGRGAFGCVAVTAPVFLSEEEARQVIAEEAKKAGINFKADAKELKNVIVPLTVPHLSGSLSKRTL